MSTQRILALACAVAIAGLVLDDARASPAGQTANPAASTPSTSTAQSATFSKDEIAQLVAPVALYPDSLLAQVLMATTYPSDVADAAKWAESHKDMKGDAAVKAVANQPWDASVQSLASFPQVLLMMGNDINWVTKLGDAFLAQPNDVMAMAQELRKKAQTAGNLKSNEYQKVSSENPQTIVIEPTSTQTVYVPTYDPNTVYGSWGYMYPPYYYPPPAYYYPGYAFGSGLAWGIGIGISIGFWGDCDWGGGDININNSRYNEFNRDINRGDRQLGDGERGGNRGDRNGNSRFQHDSSRRDGVPYRDQASRDKYGNRQAGGASRDQFRGENANRSAQRDSARQQMERQGMDPARNNQQARDRASQASRDPRSSNIGQSNAYRQSGANNAASRDLARSSGGGYGGNYGNSRNNAFSGAGNSGASRAASNRGSSSRSNMSRGGGGVGRSMSRPPSRGGGGGRRR